jgi:hypothetical protein
MSHFDRFSSPLSSERVNPYFMSLAIEEQREANKKHIVRSYIGRHFSIHGYLPDLEEIQEKFYHLDLDDDMIKEELMNF